MTGKRRISGTLAAALALNLAGFAAAEPTTTRPFMQPVAPTRSGNDAWFGFRLPGPVTDPVRGPLESNPPLPPRPARFAPGPLDPFLSGAEIRADVAHIVSFSHESRAVGDYLWGRVTGRPAFDRTLSWVEAKLRAAGLRDARPEYFAVTGLHLPVAGEVRLLGDEAFGAGSRDIVLRSAMVGGDGPVNGTLTAPLVYVGQGLEADLAGRELAGKIAVLVSTPLPSLYSAVPARRIGAAMAAGAAGVIEIVVQPGNLQNFDRDRHGCGKRLCFTLGGEDGYFLQNVLGAAARAGKTVSATLSARSETLNPRLANVVATVAGKSARTIIVIAHADGWFGGSDDNATGLAVMLALARHFAQGPKPERTLVFVASAGHHSATVNGPRAFREAHQNDYIANADLVINLEHPAQSDLMRSYLYREATNFTSPSVMASGDLAKQVAVSNEAPILIDLWRQGVLCFGLDVQRTVDRALPGDLNALADLDALPRTQMIASGGLYHTSGDDVWSVSEPALERAARFHAYLIAAADRASADQLRGATVPALTGCPATP